MALCKINLYINLIRNHRQYSTLCRTLTKTNNIKYSKLSLIGSQRWLFHESHRKGGYNTEHEVSYIDHLKNGFKELKQEFKLFGQEMKELAITDPLLIARPGQMFNYIIQLTVNKPFFFYNVLALAFDPPFDLQIIMSSFRADP